MEASEYRRPPRLVSVSVCYRLESMQLTDDCDPQFSSYPVVLTLSKVLARISQLGGPTRVNDWCACTNQQFGQSQLGSNTLPVERVSAHQV